MLSELELLIRDIERCLQENSASLRPGREPIELLTQALPELQVKLEQQKYMQRKFREVGNGKH